MKGRIGLTMLALAALLGGAAGGALVLAGPVGALLGERVAAARIALRPADAAGPAIAITGGDPALPLVVIDAGHGGFDYGARVPGYEEKDLTLALALALRDRLVADGAVRVAMTRDGDRFVPLGQRYEAARRSGAALFLSIHADSAPQSGDSAGTAKGASIYTLSQTASDAAAQRFAARENAADGVNGQALADPSGTVGAILVELAQGRTQARSERLAELIEQAAVGRIPLRSPARQSAALEVLRAPDVPSVLFESGYITNPADAARLASTAGRVETANVLARAIRLYFAALRIEAGAGGENAGTGTPSPIASPATGP